MTIEELQDKIIELQGQLSSKDKEIEVLTAEKADYTKQIEDFQNKVNELEETNKLKTEKISELIMKTPTVIDKKEDDADNMQGADDEVKDLDDILSDI